MTHNSTPKANGGITTLKNEPIKHHYIPQFILKNFCFNNNGKLHYYNKITKQISTESTRDIFMDKHLYRDEKNHPDNPTKIEKDFAVFEREAAKIINEKILTEEQIVLTYQENELLKLFFALMGFRSKRTAEQFRSMQNIDSKKLYANFQPDKDFDNLFKRNLGYLVNCRSVSEVLEHENIDDIFKVFMHRDVLGIFGQHLAVVQRHDEAEEFIITDTYPTVISGDIVNGLSVHIYSAFPLSPDRVLFMVSKGADATSRDVLSFRPLLLGEPKVSGAEQIITIRVKRMFSEEVKDLNKVLFKEAFDGVVFRDNHLT